MPNALDSARYNAGSAGVTFVPDRFRLFEIRGMDYVLLMGAIALFVVLAIVLYVTRKADWYARDSS
jgi:hypothetical protein